MKHEGVGGGGEGEEANTLGNLQQTYDSINFHHLYKRALICSKRPAVNGQKH